jgi:hypothetical protein
MKRTGTACGPTIAQALSRTGCPICILLKEHQAGSLRELSADRHASLCPVHTWAVAAAVDGERAARLLSEMLDHPGIGKCPICCQLRVEETRRIRELAEELSAHGAVAEWFRKYGMVCRPHARRLLGQMSDALQAELIETLRRNVTGLLQELREFLQHKQAGTHAAGGVLGRAAEFLAGQRGVRH